LSLISLSFDDFRSISIVQENVTRIQPLFHDNFDHHSFYRKKRLFYLVGLLNSTLSKI